ncbi:protein of unknown function [Nitrospira japonica]|uniref:Uncharacterized protein n=1 Tax=Nitrospira japonica TaxID=1325564 RepID=A0A1W1I9J6_9BACT|nr:protein of unknown function [Nitrospira japonica]
MGNESFTYRDFIAPELDSIPADAAVAPIQSREGVSHERTSTQSDAAGRHISDRFGSGDRRNRSRRYGNRRDPL